jgi:eukaryotic-like serine/threonine-protein kinase
MARDDYGSYPATPEASTEDDVASLAETPETPVGEAVRRLSPIGVAIGLAAAVLIAAVVGVWAYAAVSMPVAAPSLVSLTPTAADAVLRAAHLTSGKATYEVTKAFPAGRIIAQSPAPYARVAQGSPVNVKIAVAPKPIPVPDVVGAESSRAQSILSYVLLKPTVLYAYSKTTRADEVIEQLPRAGDTALTGSADVIVVSLGVGVPGSVVPSMIGKKFAEASAIASDTRLFVQPRAVTATGTADGTVVDQAPSPGTIVPTGTNVWLSVADSRATP